MTMPNGAARVTGLFGWPVKHSRSPRLHGYWFRAHELDAVYAPFPVAPGMVGEAVKALPALGIAGVNVTVPHKQAVIPYLDRLDGPARRIGAVNTIIVHSDGSLEGRNTDAYGFITSLGQSAGARLKQQIEESRQIAMIGAGGAARAVLDAVLEAGYRNVVITNRTEARAASLAADFQQHYPQAAIRTVDWAERASVLPETGLLINTSSLGMAGGEALDLAIHGLPDDAMVADIVYTPLVTGLLRQAMDRGLTAIDGLDMLLYQAQAAFKAWHGVEPQVDPALRQFVLDQIKG